MMLSPIADIAASIHTRHLSTPLQEAIAATPHDSAAALTASMRERQFDYVPVMDREGQPLGLFPAGGGLVDTVEEAMRPIDAHMLVSADAGISALIEKLIENPFLFVVEGTSISGFVTQADLTSAPARTYYYLLLSQVEIALAEHVRVEYPRQDDTLAHLSEDSRARVQDRVQYLMQRDEFIDVVASLGLEDLLRIAGKDQRYQEAVKAHSGISAGRAQKGITDFRNDVMHPTRSNPTTLVPQKISRFERRLRALFHSAVELLEAQSDSGTGR